MNRKRILKSRRGHEGFTLVELLVAMTILSFGLLAVASLLLAAVTMNSLGKSTNDAMAQARDKIEVLKTLPSTDPQRNVGGSLTGDVEGYNDTVGTFHRRWEIAAGPASTRMYTVTVTPLDPDARSKKTVTMTTIF